ncbi:MAG: 2-oxoglutarate dehydrogenase complex dihydrolipoyllysine-residue succinyltransferase [Phycisphaerales bacterium]|nr:2-oxoglutarate dehydrogenase complex dihydrolipoyllysine-residue succinyltransferase [Phycisphaerales bacterium]
MTTKIEIPNVGESVTSGVISAWSVAEGEYVERDQTVLELETDKVTMEVPAPASGVVSHSAAEGDEVDVGAIVGMIDESAAKPAAAAPAVPSTGAPSEDSYPPSGSKELGSRPEGAQDGAPKKESQSRQTLPNGDVKATPLARKLAEEKGVSLSLMTGTGAGGRIREQDVLGFVQSGAGGANAPAAAAPVAGSREITVERMSPMRQKIASRLVEAQQTAAMLTTFNEVDMTAVMELRKQYKEQFAEKHGVGLGFMSFFVKACVQGLQKFPLINSYIVAGADGKPAVQSHNYQDIAIAVAGKKGLVVPVLRNTEDMSFATVESSIKDLGKRARENKLELSEMMGGTFTITNGGIFGSLMSTPILNPPQSAILGMHGIKKRAVEDPQNPGQIALRPMMYLALSYDHRIVDGAEAVQFLVSVKDAIEDPARLMLDL